MQKCLCAKLFARAKVALCNSDPSCKNIFVQLCSLVQKYLRAISSPRANFTAILVLQIYKMQQVFFMVNCSSYYYGSICFYCFILFNQSLQRCLHFSEQIYFHTQFLNFKQFISNYTWNFFRQNYTMSIFFDIKFRIGRLKRKVEVFENNSGNAFAKISSLFSFHT